MKFAVEINIGKNSTDGSFLGSDHAETIVKVNTTLDDLITGLVHCIEKGARKYGLSAREMLTHTETLKLSTFMGNEVVTQKKGPRLGLIMTRGFRDSLCQAKALITNLVLSDMIQEIEEEIDSLGTQTKPPQEEEVRLVVHHFLERGAQTIIVSLHRSWLNPVNEERVRAIIREDYPAHYLGAMPILISTEVRTTQQDYIERTSVALLNAYLHKPVANHLRQVAEALRELGYKKPLLIVNADGKITEFTKTIASNVYSSSNPESS